MNLTAWSHENHKRKQNANSAVVTALQERDLKGTVYEIFLPHFLSCKSNPFGQTIFDFRLLTDSPWRFITLKIVTQL